MNYLTEVLMMNVLAELNDLSPTEFRLWHCLMSICNSLGWRKTFTVANSTLASKTNMPVRTLQNARNRLVQRGYVEVQTRGNGKAPSYTMIPLAGVADMVAVPVAEPLADVVAEPLADVVADAVAVPLATLNKQTKQVNKTKQVNPPVVPQGTATRSQKAAMDAMFDDFWAAYPKKVAKETARSAFLKHKPTLELVEKMIVGIEKYKKTDQWTRDGGQYIPNPATWLNQKRWEDEIPTGGKTGKRVGFQAYDQTDQWQDTTYDRVGLDLLAEARAASDWREQ